MINKTELFIMKLMLYLLCTNQLEKLERLMKLCDSHDEEAQK